MCQCIQYYAFINHTSRISRPVHPPYFSVFSTGKHIKYGNTTSRAKSDFVRGKIRKICVCQVRKTEKGKKYENKAVQSNQVISITSGVSKIVDITRSRDIGV